ncbi:CoA transferase, partial [Mycobacterium malmoense]
AAVIAAWALGPARDSGAVIDLSMAEVVASTVAEFVAAASAPEGVVSDSAAAARGGVYRSADDRWVAVELSAPADWARLTELAEEPDQLAALIAGAPAREAAARLTTAGLRAAVVQRADDLVSDPHLAARGFFPEITHPDPDIGTARLVGLPWRFIGQGPLPLAPPPALGDANARQERMTSAG